MPVPAYRSLLPLALVLACACPAAASAQPVDPALAACARIVDATARLACYDRLARADANAGATEPAAQQASAPATAPGPAAEAPSPTLSGTSLADVWELDAAHKRGVFNFRPNQPNYLMATRTAHPNNAPYRPFRDITKLGTNLAHSELVFQLGFKLKLVEDAFDKPVDLWFGYTQNSFWQAVNQQASSPFRETNYQPELMVVTPLHFSVLGMDARFLNLGFVHQSNGQSSTLSRSWNRVYLQTGLEGGGWTVLGRVWRRVNEAAIDDDNRDIVDYMGHGDVNITYRHDGNDYSALLRHNFSTGRGAVQLSWAFPLAGHFKGYTQLFSGYGQSLIDYNYYQNVLGLGLLGTF
jgi:phospholipase A1